MVNLNKALEASQGVCNRLYVALQEDTLLQRDRQLWLRLQAPALNLVATLGNCSVATNQVYRQRGTEFAKAYLSEFDAVLKVGESVGSVEDNTFDALEFLSQRVGLILQGKGE